MPMPDRMEFAAAATVPVAFLTVAYSLGHLAQLQPGERVLVHGGAGGVGLAAIQYARLKGATVFATAGSPAKRAMLRRLGVDAVLDSRSLGFADDVMRLTDGKGVDVVLNSVSGEAMELSLGLMRPFGRFLELGQARLLRQHRRGPAAVPAQHLLFRRGCRPASAAPSGAGRRPVRRGGGLMNDGCAAPAAIPGLRRRRCRGGIPADAGLRPCRQDRAGARSEGRPAPCTPALQRPTRRAGGPHLRRHRRRQRLRVGGGPLAGRAGRAPSGAAQPPRRPTRRACRRQLEDLRACGVQAQALGATWRTRRRWRARWKRSAPRCRRSRASSTPPLSWTTRSWRISTRTASPGRCVRSSVASDALDRLTRNDPVSCSWCSPP